MIVQGSPGHSPHETGDDPLAGAIAHVGHLLPAQGPIGVFIHHNTLHAFEAEPFDAAVARAAELFGAEPYLAEGDYRAALRQGRITSADLAGAVARALGPRGDEEVLGSPRRVLWARVLEAGLTPLSGPALRWHLSETDALSRLRQDLPAEAREALSTGDEVGAEAALTQALWAASLAAAERGGPGVPGAAPAGARLRDGVLHRTGVDIDDWIDAPLIRWVGAFLDQGLAQWPMPGREAGLYVPFLQIYGAPGATLAGPWAAALQDLVQEDLRAGPDAQASVRRSLGALGVEVQDALTVLIPEALALRGWAGMVHQLELRPDRAPTVPVPARLVDYLAVRLLMVRAAAVTAARRAGLEPDLAALFAARHEAGPRPEAPTAAERAWPIFQVAQLMGLEPATLHAWTRADVEALEGELDALHPIERRRVLHHAFERHLRHRFFDALAQHPAQQPEVPRYQVMFCIDEREESFRRHLEEVAPRSETVGTAGFFGIAMYHQAATDARPRPLCPVVIEPQHYVAHAEVREDAWSARWREMQGGLQGMVSRGIHRGGRSAIAGALLTSTVGALWSIPLVLQVLFPRVRRRDLLRRSTVALWETSPRLLLDRDEGVTPPVGRHAGFTVEEMAKIVRGELVQTGLAGRLAPMVVVLGHGSTSQNNPHRSVYDCGACGGGAGGPNARALAAMGNDPRVRAHLEAEGLHIPGETWFVGGQRNTTNNDVLLYDTDLVPVPQRALLEQIAADLDEARRREAHERCRRFETFPAWFSEDMALAHVQGRAADVAQTRPEYGHSTNAFAVIGRRARTRGLFLDRRAFLVSFDPTRAGAEATLTGLLNAVVPVVMGISLEYFFGRVDPATYGCGTKLPHNVTALLGVMDGPSSDLRTGLHWQTLELHEPVRLTLLVEVDLAVMQRILHDNPRLASLVEHGWLILSVLSPEGGQIWTLGRGAPEPFHPEHGLAVVEGGSRAHYGGRRGHLPFVAIRARAAAPGAAA
jgi:uncharacterized protein YbcC (UPF0753/DUF2309 family)